METRKEKWYNKTWLVILLCVLFAPIGIYALWKNDNYSKAIKIVFTVVFAILFIVVISGDENKINPNSSEVIKETENSGINVGQVLHSNYFDIIINKVSIKNRVSTGNEYLDLKPEDDIKYLILNITFKNTSDESRMLFDGIVIINYNNKEYKFDKTETVMAEGWGLMLDQINPLTSKSTNLVYKIPSEITGNAYYEPARDISGGIIFLGNITQ